MKHRITKKHLREQLALATAHCATQNEAVANLKGELAALRSAQKLTLEALQRVRRERDELQAPITRATSPVLIIAMTQSAGHRLYVELGLTPNQCRIITEPHQLRGYRNRRYAIAYNGGGGGSNWPEMMLELDRLVATAGFEQYVKES